MIRLKSKVGLVIEFNMSSEDKEEDLVNKFIIGSVKQTTLLKLGKYGTIQVKDILDLQFVPKSPKTVGEIKLEDIFYEQLFKNGSKNF